MKKEDLYRAIGNISDRYIVSVKDKLKLYGDSSSDILSEKQNGYDERVIEVGVIKSRKKIKLYVLLAAAVVLIGAVGVMVFMKLNKKTDNNENRITNYFQKDEDFSIQCQIKKIDQLSTDGENIYFSALLEPNGSEKHFAAIANTADNRKTDIDFGEKEPSDMLTVMLSEDYALLYLTYDNQKHALIKADRKTGKVTASAFFSENEWVSKANETDDGGFILEKYDLIGGEISDYILEKYDSSLNKKSEMQILDKDILKFSDFIFSSAASAKDGSFYTLYSDDENNYILMKYSEDGNVVYKKDNIVLGEELIFCGFFVSRDGDPVIFSQNFNDSSLCFFDKYSSDDGEKVQSIDIIQENENIVVSRGGFSDEYDLMLSSCDKVYGLDLEEEEITLISDLDQFCPNSSGILYFSVCGNDILFSGTDSSNYTFGEYLCKADEKGNLISKSYHSLFGKYAYLLKMYISEDSKVWLMVQSDDPETVASEWSILCLDEKLNILSSKVFFEGTDRLFNSFIADNAGNLAVFDYTDGELALFGSNGDRKYSQKRSGDNIYFFRGGSDYYFFETTSESQTDLFKIDFNNYSIEKTGVLDFSIKGISDGYGQYDVCITEDEGIYGYSLKKNTADELINWIDSDISDCPSLYIFTDEDTLYSLVQFDEYDSLKSISRYKRAGEDVLDNIKNRKVVNVAVCQMSDEVKNLVNDFNKKNTKYKIHIDDYSKYEFYDDKNMYHSGFSELEKKIIKGDVPDMVLFDSEFDYIRYLGYDAFENMDTVLKGTGFKREDYFENVLDAYRINGKQTALPLSFCLTCLVGKKETIENRTNLTVSEFDSDDKALFYGEAYSSLVKYLINYNIQEYIDLNEFTCSFDNEEFVKLLEIIKKYGVTNKEYEEKLKENIVGIDARIADDVCMYMPYYIKSFNAVSMMETVALCGGESSLAGFPSKDHNNTVISPDITAAVFKKSNAKDGAVELLKEFLADDNLYDFTIRGNNYMYSFPVKKSVYDRVCELKKENSDAGMTVDCHNNEIKGKPVNDETLDSVNNAISMAVHTSLSDSSVREIIFEQTDKYFSDAQSAEETAKNIQSKVSMYLKDITTKRISPAS